MSLGFFFKQKTAYELRISDWSSDVCSSDLRETLTPDTIVSELLVSRSQLYRQFERLGGVQHYVRQRRLRQCLLALCNPLYAGQRIADIAYERGFSDEAHFSRLFRADFGISPRAARQAAARGDDAVRAALVPRPEER